MKFLELIKIRESVRAYSDKPVEREVLERCVEAARLAPSACNSQPWKFVIIDNPELKEKVARETYSTVVSFNKFAMQAPVLIAIIMERPTTISQIGGRIKNKDYYLFDIGIAAEHFCLQAAEEGLGTCMMGWFNEKKIMELLHIPSKRSVGLIISVGYPKTGDIREKKRKTKEEILTYNKYQ
jgi:nitroreductase